MRLEGRARRYCDILRVGKYTELDSDTFRYAVLIGAILLLLASGTILSMSVASADEDYINVVDTTNTVDLDEDGYYSDFDIHVDADTDLDTGFRTTDPYFEVSVDGSEVLTEDVPATWASFHLEIDQSDLEDLDLERGSVEVNVELKNSQIGDHPVYDEDTVWVQYEPEVDDKPIRTKSIEGLEQIYDVYPTYSEQVLNPNYWHDVAMDEAEESIEIGMDALTPGAKDALPKSEYLAIIDLMEQGFTLLSAFDARATATTVAKGDNNEKLRSKLDELEQNRQDVLSEGSTSDRQQLLEERVEILQEIHHEKKNYKNSVVNNYGDDPIADWCSNRENLLGYVACIGYDTQDEADERLDETLSDLGIVLESDWHWTNAWLANSESYSGPELDGEPVERPSPNIKNVDLPDSVVEGESFEVEIDAENEGEDAEVQTIAVSFPDGPTSSDIEFSGHNLDLGSGYPAQLDSGEEAGAWYGRDFTDLDYTLVELGGEFDSGESHYMDLQVTVPEGFDRSEMELYIKSVAREGTAWSSDPETSESSTVDQQGEYVYVHTVDIVEEDTLEVTSSPHGAEVYLNGDFVGTTPWSGDRPVTESYTVEVDKDDYESETRTGVSPPDEEHFSLDSDLDPADFQVDIEGYDSEVTEGDTITVDVTIENMGDESDTQTVEASISGVGSDSEPVSLDGDSSTPETFFISTSTGDAGTRTLEVDTEGSSETRSITINEEEDDDPDPDPDPPDFDVSIEDDNSPITEGDTLTVDATVTNFGEESDGQTIDLDIEGLGSDSEFVSLDGNESDDVELSVGTSTGDAEGSPYTAEVSSNDDSDSVNVVVEGDSGKGDDVIFEDDFTEYNTGTSPDVWTTSGNTNHEVVDSTSVVGGQSYQISGSSGGCWETISKAKAPIPDEPDIQTTISFSINPTTEGLEGCHSHRASIKYYVDSGSWSVDGNTFLSFETDDTISSRVGELGSYSPGDWYDVEIEHTRTGGGQVDLNYYIDGELVGSGVVDEDENEDSFEYLGFRSGEFTSYIDDVSVTTSTTGDDTEPDVGAVRSIEDTEVEPGETTTVTVDVELDDDGTGTLVEEFTPEFEEVEITEVTGEGLEVANPDGVEVSWLGDLAESPPTSVSVEYQVTVPEDTDATEFNFEGELDGNGVTGDSSISVEALTDETRAYIESSDVHVESGGMGESSITVDAEDGLLGAFFSVSVDPDVAEIASVEPGDDLDSEGYTLDVFEGDSGYVDIEYTDISADSNPVTDFEIATVVIDVHTFEGETPLTLESPELYDGDDFAEYDVTVIEGEVSVGELDISPLPGFDTPPQNTGELDSTLYEDLSGDGEGTDISQTVHVFGELIRGNDLGLTDEEAELLDWDDDSPSDEVTVADMVALFGEQIRA